MSLGDGMEELPRSYPFLPPPPPPLSRSLTPSWRHDVFISFSGEDVRDNFADHLRAGLVERGIKAYRDDKNLGKGNAITKSLLRAIEKSRGSIVIFSKNYAHSKWCLDELVKIVKCNKVTGHIIFPVFFDVEPDHVVYQTGAYEAAFQKHDKDFKKTRVGKWRAALKKSVADISGWEKSKYGSESKLIRLIANRILRKLRYAGPIIDEQMAQLNAKIENMNLKLYKNLEEIGSIHFHGMKWIRQRWDITANNLKRKKLKCIQVHVIVDQVEKLKQLVKDDFFGPGSTIIIAARNPITNITNVRHLSCDEPISGSNKIIVLDLICFFNEINDDSAERIKEVLCDIVLKKPGMKVLSDEFEVTTSDNNCLMTHEHTRHNILEVKEIDGITEEESPQEIKSIKGTMVMEPLANGAHPTEASKPQLLVSNKVKGLQETAPPEVEVVMVPDGVCMRKENIFTNGLNGIQKDEEVEGIAKPKTQEAAAEEVEKVVEEVEANSPWTPKEMQYSSSKSSRSSVDLSPEFLQQQKKDLGHYFSMSLEAIHQAGDFNDIEQILCTLIQHVSNQHERESLEDLIMPRLAEFKQNIPVTITTAETEESQRTYLLEKFTELNASLVRKQKRLSSLEVKLSKISEEEGKLEMEIQQLIARKEQLLVRKKSTAFQLENYNKEVSKYQEEGKMMEEEIKQANRNWYRAKERLVLANANWKFFKECLEV